MCAACHELCALHITAKTAVCIACHVLKRAMASEKSCVRCTSRAMCAAYQVSRTHLFQSCHTRDICDMALLRVYDIL